VVTERTSEYSGACACGAGTLEIECCSSDNGYRVYPDFYETYVKCAECRRIYDIEQVGKAFHLVHRSEIEQIASKKEEYWVEAAKLGDEARQKGIISGFAKMLDSQGSVAAVHRILKRSGLERGSVATFRKYWRNGSDYLGTNGSGQDIPKILTVFNTEDATIKAAAAKLHALGKEAYANPNVIEPPFYIAA
jgi:hypothetical protein